MTGLFAAVATPIDDGGRLDLPALDRLIDFLVGSGVHGICIGGATGEYPHFEAADRIALVRRAAARLPADRALLVGIGSASLRRTIEIGKAALEAKSRALLLPMPMFFNYAQEDLAAYAAHVSRALRAPCLLYNLPDFTNPIAPDTAIALMRDEPFIAGMKDSSGQVDHLGALLAARGDRAWTLLVGDDRLLLRGLTAGWDGGISGVACCCPELLVRLYRSAASGRPDEAAALQQLLDELIARLSVFPTPWGIRIALAARGHETGPLPLPLSDARQRQVAEFQDWFRGWLPAARFPLPASR